jgi:hypothetical protein
MADIDIKLEPQVINFLGIPYDDDFRQQLNITETINDVVTPYDWTGATVLAECVDNLRTPNPAMKFAFTTDIAVNGRLIIEKMSADLNGFGAGSWYYSIRITKGGYTRTYFRGIFQRIATPTWD